MKISDGTAEKIYALIESVRKKGRSARKWEKVDAATDAVLIVAQLILETNR